MAGPDASGPATGRNRCWALRNLASPSRWLLPALRLGTALAALALILLPGELWSRPDFDLTAEGFDPETVYVDQRGDRYLYDPFQVLTNGEWRTCPCAPGSELSLVGNELSPVTLSDPEGDTRLGPVSVTVDGRPARMHLVSPGQIGFVLPDDTAPPSATIRLLHDDREVARLSVPIATSLSGGAVGTPGVSIEPESLRLRAAASGTPAVHLLTTPLSFRASFAVTVEGESGDRPFEAMLWNPRNSGAVSLLFGPGPDRRIEAVVSENRGRVIARRDLGPYDLGRAYRVQVSLDRGQRVELRAAPVDAPSLDRSASFTPAEAPAFFEAYRPTLTVLSRAVQGSQSVTLSAYRLELPPDRLLTVRADDAKILPLALALLLISGALHAPLIIRGPRRAGVLLRRLSLSSGGAFLRRWWWVAVPGLAFAVGAGFLMRLGSHPFDMASQKAWTYILVQHGINDLYYRAQTIPLAAVWDGMPYHEAVFPYGVVMSYYFYAIGWVHNALGGSVTLDSAGLEVTIKATSLLVAVADAVLLLALARGLCAKRESDAGGGRHRGLLFLVPLAFLANPAVLFDVTVWGETEPVALFPLLASLLAAQRSSPRWAWGLLALAVVGKQTMALPVFLTAVYYLRLFPFRQTLQGFSVATPLVLLVSMPYLAAGYPPSIALDPILGSIFIFGGSEMEEAFQTVSFDSYNLWSLVTLWRDGAHGLSRLHFPDQTGLGPLSYHQVGVLAFFAAIAGLTLWLLTSRRVSKEPQLIFLVLALGMLAELLLPTRSIARYLVFPLIFALVAAGGAQIKAAWFVVGALTLTSLVGMYGSVASGLESSAFLAPRLAPANNPLSALALHVFRSDPAITLGALLNLAALLSLATTLWLPPGATLRVRRWLPARRRRPLPAEQPAE